MTRLRHGVLGLLLAAFAGLAIGCGGGDEGTEPALPPATAPPPAAAPDAADTASDPLGGSATAPDPAQP